MIKESKVFLWRAVCATPSQVASHKLTNMSRLSHAIERHLPRHVNVTEGRDQRNWTHEDSSLLKSAQKEEKIQTKWSRNAIV